MSFLKNRSLWLQLCSCLDVIGDAELAIAAYSAGEFGKSDGPCYLATYGLLQALILEQDAVFNMCESLGVPEKLDNYPQLKEIRGIRNVSIGHPTKKERPKSEPVSYHFISRPTLSPHGFQLLSFYNDDGEPHFKKISVPELISEQSSFVSQILHSVVDKLECEEKAHKEQFRMEKLVAVFPEYLGHSFQKVFEAARASSALGSIDLRYIKEALQKFQEALARRDIELETYTPIKVLYEEIEYPLSELEDFFRNIKDQKQSAINEKTAYIFIFFVEKKFDELKKIAQELDDYYST